MRWLWVVLVLFSALLGAPRTFLDVNNKEVVLPAQLSRIFTTAPPVSFLIAVIDDTPLMGVNFPQVNKSNKNGDKFLSKHFMELPMLGTWHGDSVPNLETILEAKPELLVTWDTPLLNQKISKDLARISVPTLKVNIDDAHNYPDVFRFMGKVLNKEERANKLADMASKYLKEIDQFVKTLPEEKRVKLYYAEEEDGLATDCDKSFHTEAFVLAGADLVHKCQQATILGLQRVSFEQVATYEPDVIIVQEASFFKKIFDDSKWKTLKAVQNKRVYLVPNTPFNWVDRPPSFMRILSAHWVASRLYPKQYCHSIQDKVKEFYTLFFNVTLSDEELKRYFNL